MKIEFEGTWQRHHRGRLGGIVSKEIGSFGKEIGSFFVCLVRMLRIGIAGHRKMREKLADPDLPQKWLLKRCAAVS